MTNTEAAEILMRLAENQTEPRIIGALFIGANALGGCEPLEKPEVTNRRGDPWSCEEETRLKIEFSSGTNLQEIAKAHQRSDGAIRSRLEKLGLLMPPI